MKGFLEFSNLFTYFCYNFFSDISNLANLLALTPSSIDISKTSNISTNFGILRNKSPNSPSS